MLFCVAQYYWAPIFRLPTPFICRCAHEQTLGFCLQDVSYIHFLWNYTQGENEWSLLKKKKKGVVIIHFGLLSSLMWCSQTPSSPPQHHLLTGMWWGFWLITANHLSWPCPHWGFSMNDCHSPRLSSPTAFLILILICLKWRQNDFPTKCYINWL